MHLDQFCRAAVGPWDELVPCDCEVIQCEDGSMNGAINCSDYEEGLFINLCDSESADTESVLSVLQGDHYGECTETNEEIATQVERAGGSEEDAGTRSKSQEMEKEDSFPSGETSGDTRRILTTTWFAGLLVAVQLCLVLVI